MWVKNISHLEQSSDTKFINWLLRPTNLGEALRRVCKKLTVNVLEQNFESPFEDEKCLLGLEKMSCEENTCYIRRIFLEGDGLPFSFGRVVVPKSVYLNHMDDFNLLGTKLIGETLLYGNSTTTRSSFEYNHINVDHPIFNLIIKYLPESSIIPLTFWARRSVFYINGNEPLLITEVFLEEIPAFVA